MHREPRARSFWGESLGLPMLVPGVMAIWILVIVNAQAETDLPGNSGESEPAQVALGVAGPAVVSGSAVASNGTPVTREDPPRPSRPSKLRRVSSAARGGSSDAWYWEMGCVALVLAVCGGLVTAARRFMPQGGAGGLQIISRVSLSPKHSVYVVRAGRRLLLVGAGPQGPPALISELDDFPENEPTASQGEES